MELGLHFNDQELVARFPNGSRVYFVGGETISEIEKLRGGRYHGAIVDECKSYSPNVFQTLLDEILQPALNTMRGPLIIIGTPGDVLAGEFYLATCQPAEVIETPGGKRVTNHRFGQPAPDGVAPKWSLHVWTLADNTAVPHLWADALATKERNGWADDHPVWRREYLGHWVATDRWLVYRYAPHRHDYIPSGKGRFGLSDEHEWRTVLGVDLGTRDGTAMVVWAYSPTHEGLWEVYSEVRRFTKEGGQKFPIRLLVEWYREIANTYGPFEAEVVDPGGLANFVVDTLADEHQIYWEPAEKKQKLDYIELFNGDLDARLIRTLPGSDLTAELLTNRWDERQMAKNKREEDRATPNDTCDAALYAFRWCNHRRAQEKAAVVAPNSPAWWAAVQAAELEAAKEAARRRAGRSQDFANLDRDTSLVFAWEN